MHCLDAATRTARQAPAILDAGQYRRAWIGAGPVLDSKNIFQPLDSSVDFRLLAKRKAGRRFDVGPHYSLIGTTRT